MPRFKLNYANVISTLCLFLMLAAGTAYAANQLGKNTVGTKQLKKNAVNGAKVKDQSLTGKDINLAKLGTVPSATSAGSAQTAAVATTANGLVPPESIRVIGSVGQPPFENGASNFTVPGATIQPAGFYKDHDGIVHLEGAVKAGTEGFIFNLPPGYRPANGTVQIFPAFEEQLGLVVGSGVNVESIREGDVLVPSQAGKTVILTGITFRAGS